MRAYVMAHNSLRGEFLAINLEPSKFYAWRLFCEISVVSWFTSRKSPTLSRLHYFVYVQFIAMFMVSCVCLINRR